MDTSVFARTKPLAANKQGELTTMTIIRRAVMVICGDGGAVISGSSGFYKGDSTSCVFSRIGHHHRFRYCFGLYYIPSAQLYH